MAFGETAADRLTEVRQAVRSFFDRHVEDCPAAADLESRFFYRFDDAYLATDALLLEAGVFPLSNPFEDSAEQASEPEGQ
ncbi:hypothetical protein [Alteriqipengyuania sp.]|uniref:hypothetical protein n=1 Tax=Alteriqipengyuania sp. TaxID=2800692 RepID=UPI003514AC22